MFKSACASALLAAAATAASADYTSNGADWPDLCQTGVKQSPIDLTTDTDTSDKMEFIGYNYFDFPVHTDTFKDDDLTFTISFSDNQLRQNAELQLVHDDGSKGYYTPLQFHFHAPSEHTVDGKNYDLEVHFVHYIKGSDTSSTNGETSVLLGAVIGVFFDVEDGADTNNPFIDSVIKGIESKGTDEASNVAVRQFLATVDMTDYWSYPGSLTTPPCTEGIAWTVVRQVQPISKEQLKFFTAGLADNPEFAGGNGNNRVVQGLNERTLYYSGAESLIAGVATAFAAIAALSF